MRPTNSEVEIPIRWKMNISTECHGDILSVNWSINLQQIIFHEKIVVTGIEGIIVW